MRCTPAARYDDALHTRGKILNIGRHVLPGQLEASHRVLAGDDFGAIADGARNPAGRLGIESQRVDRIAEGDELDVDVAFAVDAGQVVHHVEGRLPALHVVVADLENDVVARLFLQGGAAAERRGERHQHEPAKSAPLLHFLASSRNRFGCQS
jgi:hypothetical protein